jgi:hypothetical protein
VFSHRSQTSPRPLPPHHLVASKNKYLPQTGCKIAWACTCRQLMNYGRPPSRRDVSVGTPVFQEIVGVAWQIEHAIRKLVACQRTKFWKCNPYHIAHGHSDCDDLEPQRQTRETAGSPEAPQQESLCRSVVSEQWPLTVCQQART